MQKNNNLQQICNTLPVVWRLNMRLCVNLHDESGGVDTKSIAMISNNLVELSETYQLLMQNGRCQSIHTYTDSYAVLAEIIEIDCELIFIDMELKDMNPMELSARLIKCKPKIKIVMMAKDSKDALEAIQMGAVDYLIKPLNIEQVQKVSMREKSKNTRRAIF